MPRTIRLSVSYPLTPNQNHFLNLYSGAEHSGAGDWVVGVGVFEALKYGFAGLYTPRPTKDGFFLRIPC